MQHRQCLADVGGFPLPENLAGVAAGHGIAQFEHVREVARRMACKLMLLLTIFFNQENFSQPTMHRHERRYARRIR
ncbi:protein of unknown function [Pseudomonas sp. JV551A1]|uniref:Uncharacterized protein n=1 Tax=Pseudomonas inefficax TaxID=2078786 RepID=A0AAQ1P8W8_9PSED|nr:protein of unknown function [Pseudomonas sp. JV551A1]SPO61335.1 protein of unknown function [Pseudomonas inefficax]